MYLNCDTDLFQGHIGENPFDNGSWGKEHFQPSTVPWQLNPRSHGRPSVSAFILFLSHLTYCASCIDYKYRGTALGGKKKYSIYNSTAIRK